MEVTNDKRVVDDLRTLDHIRSLWDELSPLTRFGAAHVDGDDTAARGSVVGLKVKDRASVSHESVRGIEIVEQPDHRRLESRMLRIAEVLIVDAIAAVGPEPDGVDGVASVGADFHGKAPVGMIGPFVDQPVGRLIGAELVVIDFLVVVDLEQRIGAGRRLGIAAVEKPGAVMRPRRARELDPLEMIAAVLLRRYIPDPKFLPVRSAARRAVDQRAPVFGEREDRERDRAVGREGVGIEQDRGLRRQGALRIQHRLVLQSRVLEEEVAATLLERRAVFRIVPQLGETAPDPLAFRDLLKVCERDAILCLHPGARLGRVHILEPAIGVGNSGAVVIIDHVTLVRRRIGERLSEHEGHEQRRHDA